MSYKGGLVKLSDIIKKPIHITLDLVSVKLTIIKQILMLSTDLLTSQKRKKGK